MEYSKTSPPPLSPLRWRGATLQKLPRPSAILLGADDTDLRIWDRKTGKVIRRLKGNSIDTPCVAVSPDGKLAVSGGVIGNKFPVRVWEPHRRL